MHHVWVHQAQVALMGQQVAAPVHEALCSGFHHPNHKMPMGVGFKVVLVCLNPHPLQTFKKVQFADQDGST
ncbi:hypothetical protein DC3_23540 [Deinococcus cellulosilyticus NBRC 106333 = KACC 11606]|uniref:Uncharacterized protein n=1 Tax=Deinococcus cellulosilyticus (strain DSM 18568 / NBRC 106333 / KACC 11606 / 5516J-15) TaxID=1223518 RepID=A0A511N1N1_DEIC1|nr:hypothetical protein DC3_23540 [Deinococcus cellulosilyticus NBRC 106333 = KACC 11606]